MGHPRHSASHRRKRLERYEGETSVGRVDESLPSANSETIRKSALLIASLAAILVTLVVSVFAQNLLPKYTSGYALFQYGGGLVGIDLYGAIVPLLACLPLLYLTRNHTSIPEGRGFLRRRLFGVSLVLACLLPVLPFAYVQESSGSLALGTLGGALAIILGGLLGSSYAIARGRGLSILQGGSECFIICVLGLFVSDVARTLTGLTREPGQALIWGGGGSHDLVLWFGIYMALSYLTFRLTFPRSLAFLL